MYLGVTGQGLAAQQARRQAGDGEACSWGAGAGASAAQHLGLWVCLKPVCPGRDCALTPKLGS